MYRVDARGADFEGLPARLGGFRTSRGANLTLISDPGLLGLADARRDLDLTVAPPSRIMLDLFLEPRGAAAVEVFSTCGPRRKSVDPAGNAAGFAASRRGRVSERKTTPLSPSGQSPGVAMAVRKRGVDLGLASCWGQSSRRASL
jgi:hypothetical protein